MATKSKFYTDLGIASQDNSTVDGDLTVTGNLTVSGTSFTIDSTTVSVASGATYEVDSTDTIGSLAGNGSVILNDVKVLSAGDAGSTEFSGEMTGPGGFTKIWEAEKKNVHQFSSKTHGKVPSYDQKTKKVTIEKATTISMCV